jgi:hypothetical protein
MREVEFSENLNLQRPKEITRKNCEVGKEGSKLTGEPYCRRISASTTRPSRKLRPGRSMPQPRQHRASSTEWRKEKAINKGGCIPAPCRGWRATVVDGPGADAGDLKHSSPQFSLSQTACGQTEQMSPPTQKQNLKLIAGRLCRCHLL